MTSLSIVRHKDNIKRVHRGAAPYHGARKPQPPRRLRGAGAGLALAACAAPVVFGFVLPGAILLRLAIVDPDAQWDARVLALVANSATAAGIAPVLAVTIAVVMTYAGRLSRSPLVAGANRVASLGYAIPGAVIAVGIMVPLGRLDNAVAAWLERAFGVDVGLLVTGTIAALIYAYLVSFLAVALQPVEAGLSKVTPSMDGSVVKANSSPSAGTRLMIPANAV